MEPSLTAPVAGRVREVLVSANVQVAAGRAALQIEPLDDAPAAAEGERVASTPRRPPSARSGPSALERLDWLVLGYDVRRRGGRGSSATCSAVLGRARRDLARPASSACSRSTPTCARSAARARATRTPRRAVAARRSTCTRSCARSTPRPRACPSASSRSSSARCATTGSTASSAPPALEDAAYRLFLAQQRAARARRRRARSSSGRLEQRRPPATDAGERPRVLDRLEAALAPREPALAELAREVRWRCCDRPLIEPRATRPTPSCDEHLAALARGPDDGDREAHVAGAGRLPAAAGAAARPAHRDATPELRGAARGDDPALLPDPPARGRSSRRSSTASVPARRVRARGRRHRARGGVRGARRAARALRALGALAARCRRASRCSPTSTRWPAAAGARERSRPRCRGVCARRRRCDRRRRSVAGPSAAGAAAVDVITFAAAPTASSPRTATSAGCTR